MSSTPLNVPPPSLSLSEILASNHMSFINYAAEDELVAFEEQIKKYFPLVADPNHFGEMIYYPARFTQAPTLPEVVSRKARVVYSIQKSEWTYGRRDSPGALAFHQHHRAHQIAIIQSRARDVSHSSRWLDLTQFELHPIFTGLLEDRFSLVHGMCEIKLSILSDVPWNRLISRKALPKGISNGVGAQFVKHPLVFTLHVGMWKVSNMVDLQRRLIHLITISDLDGIKVGRLLTALESASTRVIREWTYQAKELRDAVSWSHWRHDEWFLSGAPTLVVSFDSRDAADLGSSHGEDEFMYWWPAHRRLQSREVRQSEWMPSSWGPSVLINWFILRIKRRVQDKFPLCLDNRWLFFLATVVGGREKINNSGGGLS